MNLIRIAGNACAIPTHSLMNSLYSSSPIEPLRSIPQVTSKNSLVTTGRYTPILALLREGLR